jgi:hypothetical protein
MDPAGLKVRLGLFRVGVRRLGLCYTCIDPTSP